MPDTHFPYAQAKTLCLHRSLYDRPENAESPKGSAPAEIGPSLSKPGSQLRDSAPIAAGLWGLGTSLSRLARCRLSYGTLKLGTLSYPVEQGNTG
jgi:hypothetical protein